METDSLIQALRRFIARRGNIRLIRCDNGTNFVGAKSELKRSLSEMDEDKISHFLQNGGTDWVTSLGAPDKISTCDTISITKVTQYKFERRITNHTTN